MRIILKIAIALFVAVAFVAAAQVDDHQEHEVVYSTSKTTIGTLLENPATRAVLVEHIPELINNEGIQQASGMTLQAVQNFAPDMLPDEKLAAIDADLAELDED